MKTLIFTLLTLFGQLTFAATGRVCFYEDINYRGASFCVNAGAQQADLSTTGWNRRISSVAINNASVVLYSQFNFGGNKANLSVSRSDLRQMGWNDVAASFQTGPAIPQACFFKDINYGGAHFCVTPGRQIVSLVQSGWNDKISSVMLIGDSSAYIYTDVNFGGRMLWVRSSTPNLVSYGWNDRSSSLIVTPSAGRRFDFEE